ncbi:MAG: hypothetical protein U9Q15_00625 [Patescibacteria group bacterium]|nr:hypothetical protein [Patescibacteria group bacterium]
MKTITLTDQWVSTMIERNPQFLAYAQENADSVTVQQFFLDSE